MHNRVIAGGEYAEAVSSTAVDPAPGAVDTAIARFRTETGCEPVRLVVAGPSAADPGAASGRDVPASVLASQYPDPDPRIRIEIHGVGPGAAVRRPVPGATLVEPAHAVTTDGTAAAGATLLVTAEGDPDLPFGAQFESVFERFDEALLAVGMNPDDLVRTWFYVDDIHRNYAEFNAVRDGWFDRWSLRAYPSSTGIGARPAGGGLVSAVAEAVSDVKVREITTARQLPPSDYGSRFVRANSYTRNGCDVLNISGISSIDEHGHSLRTDDETAVAHCVESFCDLLDGAGMEPADLQSFYLYSVSAPVASIMREHARRAGLPEPAIATVVDVCRPDLRVEIEGRAVARSA